MNSQQKFEHLLGEVETFLKDEVFAIEQENWGYLDEILKKKEGHLKAMESMRAEVDVRPVLSRMVAVATLEAECAAALKAKMDEVKQAHVDLDAIRGRVDQVRELSRMQNTPAPQGSFKAQA